MLNERLVEYVNDVENPLTNFNLAVEYKKINQTASAISFFLRAADRTDDLDLAYECLIHMGECFDNQGNRSNTVLGLYKHAISILPKRPEAYYKISNYQNWYSQYQDATYFSNIALKTADFDVKPFREKCKYFGRASLIYEKAISLWWWGKINECKENFETLYLEHWDDLDQYHKDKIKDYYSKYNFGNIMETKVLENASNTQPENNAAKVVDFFPFFAPTGKEMLELRYNILKDYVDEFVVCESNRTISGVPIEYELRKILDELEIPKEKFRIIDLDIPEDGQLTIKEIDKINCYEGNYNNLNSVRARVRERMQKDSLLQVIDDYSDDTIFIHSDSDEIINPKNLEWIIPIVKNIGDDKVLKIPLVHLEGKADLRVYLKDSDTPKPWCNSMILCKKQHFKKATPTQIRSNVYNPLEIVRLTQGTEVIQDLGWHFSWMGPAKNRVLKSKYFTHYDDKFDFLVSGKYGSEETKKFQEELVLKEGSMTPSCEENTILKNYSHEFLPKEVFDLPRVKNYLLSSFEVDTKKDAGFTFYNKQKPTVWIVDNFYDDPYAVREFALKQNFIEGGFGRGFIGRRTEKQFLFPGLKEAFESIMGQKITNWESYGENGKFQNCIAGESLVYHVDAQKWGAVLYLSPDAPYQCGTTLWAHKQNRARNWFDPGWDAAWIPDKYPGDNHLDGTHFEPVDVCGNVFNRLFIFDASSIHSASQYYGGVIENSRLWQMFFFDT